MEGSDPVVSNSLLGEVLEDTIIPFIKELC